MHTDPMEFKNQATIRKEHCPKIFFMMSNECDPIADRMKTSIVGRGYKNCWLAEPTNVTQVGMKLRKYDHRVGKV